MTGMESVAFHSTDSMLLHKLLLVKGGLRCWTFGARIPSKTLGLLNQHLMLALLGWKKCFQTFKSTYFLVSAM